MTNLRCQLYLCAVCGYWLVPLPDVSAQLVGHWKLDDPVNAGTAIDSSPGMHDGTVGAGITLGVPGIAGTAADFADAGGINANMGGDWVTGAGARTITAWFNADTFSNGQQGIFGNGGQTGDFTRFDINAETVSGNESIFFRYQGGNIGWSANEIGGLEANEWYHLAIVVPDNATFGDVDAYIDGNLLTADGGNMNSLGTMLATTGNMFIGDTGAFFDGTIDDVQYYNTELTADDITSLFQNPGLSLDEINAAVVPEPHSIAIWSILTIVLAGFACMRARRK